jgi:hypothetical protein
MLPPRFDPKPGFDDATHDINNIVNGMFFLYPFTHYYYFHHMSLTTIYNTQNTKRIVVVVVVD